MGVCCSRSLTTPGASPAVPPVPVPDVPHRPQPAPQMDAGESSVARRPGAPEATEEEMLAAIMAMPSHQKRRQSGDNERYVQWLRRGDAGSTPAVAPAMPLPPAGLEPRGSQVPSIAESDETQDT